MNIVKNIASGFGVRQLLLTASIVIFLILTSCSSSNNAQTSKHRKPVSTGKRKCGCSMLTPPANQAIKLYQQTYYVVQA